MKLVSLDILPGIYTEKTGRTAKPRWKDGSNVRFYAGDPQKIGGWQKLSGQFTGYCRALLNWTTLTGDYYVALGTHLKLMLWTGGAATNITPVRASGTLGADPFETVNGSTTVTVTDTAHGLSEGDYVTFASATDTGGLTMNGTWTVLTVNSADEYTFTHSGTATSGAIGGGAGVTYSYEIPVGLADTGSAGGWGAGAWGDPRNPPTDTLGWGSPYTGTDGIEVEARVWSLDKWGEDLIASYRGGPIYVWDASAGTGTRASEISAAPDTNQFILVSPEDRHLIAFGAHDGSNSDPLLIRWCDQEDYTDWTPTATNTAGDKRLDSGTSIMTAVRSRGQIVILTDFSAFSMYYSGPPYTYSFAPLAEHCGALSPHAAIDVNGVVYWASEEDFFIYDGVVRILPCDVRSAFFGNLNRTQKLKIYAGINQDYHEVWWFYSTADSDEIDAYVAYDYVNQLWHKGTVARTAWSDSRAGVVDPIGAGTDGYLYAHEVGADDHLSALAASVESYDFEIDGGDVMTFVSKVIPDPVDLTGTVNLTLRSRKYTQGTQTSKGPYPITPSTEKVNLRIRGRQIAVLLEWSGVGSSGRMCTLRLEGRDDGRR